MAPISSYVAPYGARLAHALPKRTLEIAFGLFLLAAAARFLVSLIAAVAGSISSDATLRQCRISVALGTIPMLNRGMRAQKRETTPNDAPPCDYGGR